MQADPSTPSRHSPAPPTGSSRLLARSMIALTAVICVAMVAVLFYRWVAVAEPEYMLIIAGTPAWAGATVTVDNVTLQKPHVRTLGGENGLKLPFYLDRGTYTVKIERDGETIIDDEVFIDVGKIWQMDLKKLEHLIQTPATTRSTDQGGVGATNGAGAPSGGANDASRE